MPEQQHPKSQAQACQDPLVKELVGIVKTARENLSRRSPGGPTRKISTRGANPPGLAEGARASTVERLDLGG